MSPLKIIEERSKYIKSHFDVFKEKTPGIIVEDWNCHVVAENRIPCLPSGFLSGKIRIISNRIQPLDNILYFEGSVLPRTPNIIEGAAIAVPIEYKEKIFTASKVGAFDAEVKVNAYSGFLDVFIKPGDEICIVTFYDGLWYAFSHSMTALVTLSIFRTKRTLIFIPRFFANFPSDLLGEYCKTIYMVDGIGVCEESFTDNGMLWIGCATKYLGSPFDTPDKFKALNFASQLELLNALLI
ncbi:hypothetical protein IPA_09795 [Ignicoccus pacificus DSM 13166]|uniref:Uncharacterized protein n=1 Tax=Ignicoccus pacificus DSM 13166 TaxID=940294 RepID=A0A977KC73_9CREN|nr:hypothetical protein IPA_09795 [Ignicoccus pacificus DSM 13166]